MIHFKRLVTKIESLSPIYFVSNISNQTRFSQQSSYKKSVLSKTYRILDNFRIINNFRILVIFYIFRKFSNCLRNNLMRKFVILKYYSNNLTFRKDLKSGFKIKSFKIKVCFDLSDSVSNFQTRDNKSLKKKNFCSLWTDRYDDIGVSH